MVHLVRLGSLGYFEEWETLQAQCMTSAPHTYADYALGVQPCGTWLEIALSHYGIMIVVLVAIAGWMFPSDDSE